MLVLRLQRLLLTGEYEWPRLIGNLPACAITFYMADCSKLLAASLAVAESLTMGLELCVVFGGAVATFCYMYASVCQIVQQAIATSLFLIWSIQLLSVLFATF